MTPRVLVASLLCTGLSLMPSSSFAGPPELAPVESSEASVAGPGPSTADEQGEQGEPGEPGELPPPTLVTPVTDGDEDDPDSQTGIEFAAPPPKTGNEELPVEGPSAPARISFPDPGMAPTDGHGQLTLGGTTIGLTIAGFSAGLAIGLRRGTPLEWLLPATIVPTVGLLAFGGGGLYLGIKRATAYRRWEIGHRVIGLPQGGGLIVGGSFAVLGAIGFGAVGGFGMRDGYTELGASLLGVGIASAVAAPIMYTIGARRARTYQRTGGWKRKPLPPLPPGAQDGVGARLRPVLTPNLTPLRGGLTLGVGGRF